MKLKPGLVAAALIGILATGGPAAAGTIYEGSDFSYGSNNNLNINICDWENDGHTAYSVARSTANPVVDQRVNDSDGYGGWCWYRTLESGIAKHYTAEDINNWPDPKSDWSYH
jgi:hypothetical protein